MPLGNVGVVFADAVTLRVVVAADAVLRKLPLSASSAQSNRVESSRVFHPAPGRRSHTV